MNEVAQDILRHTGVKRRSGRYPWGSGDSPYQHEDDFLARYTELKKQGLSEVEIAQAMKCVEGTKELRMYVRIANHQHDAAMAVNAQRMYKDGKTYQEISDSLGLSGPAQARSLVLDLHSTKREMADKTAERLREEIAKKGAIDIGEGVEVGLGISADTLNEAATRLAMTEGYNIYGIGQKEPLNPSNRRTLKVLTKDITEAELYQDPERIKTIDDDNYSPDGGVTWYKTEYPSSVSSDRIAINYGDEGGKDKDGLIEIRPGCEDLSLGDSHYAQVRILVDGDKYIKGMAVYSDDLPEGSDIRFNTNKKAGTPIDDVLKSIKDDPDNPFGTYIPENGQSHYIGKDGQEHLSAINKLRDEGKVDKWEISLSSQFLSKQSTKFAKQQLDLEYDRYADEFDTINGITNNAVKKKMLLEFSEKCDKAAEDLKAAGVPRQRNKVLLPLTDISDNEVYAPDFRNGEQVALVRYPHGGTFEIPILTVNNKNADGKKVVGQAIDAIGINSTVAAKLSGADFDGDTVSVLPLGPGVKVRTQSIAAFKGLEGFDPKDAYPAIKNADGKVISKTMTKGSTQTQMGIVSNLITDMTIKGAPPEDIAKAVKHSMVVIDAEKHKLNYTQSYIDNDIASLKKKWQEHTDLNGNLKKGGASTLISRAGADERGIKERRFKIDKETGEKVYSETGRTYYKYGTDKDGNKVRTGPFDATETVKQMSLVKDANELSTGTKIESVYADFANSMKAMANSARKTYISTPNEPKYDKNAAVAYSSEVASLNSKLKEIGENQPRQRQAVIKTNARVKEMTTVNPELKEKSNKSKLNKRTAQLYEQARVNTGSATRKLSLTDGEWKALQSGAISYDKAEKILNKMDPDELRQRTMPKKSASLTTNQKNRITHLKNAGHTQAEIADAMGISTSTVSKYLRGDIK